jgi:hypothetical protein
MRAWRCTKCDQIHEGVPLHYGAPAPTAWFSIPAIERASRSELTSDQCVIDGSRVFILGNLDIPVQGASEVFSWDVWVEVDLPTFLRICDLWDEPGRELEPPYAGTMNSVLPGYEGTNGLRVELVTRTVGRRPLVSVLGGHQLASDQREGLSIERVESIAVSILHGEWV